MILDHLLQPHPGIDGEFLTVSEEPVIGHRFPCRGRTYFVAWKAKRAARWLVYVAPVPERQTP